MWCLDGPRSPGGRTRWETPDITRPCWVDLLLPGPHRSGRGAKLGGLPIYSDTHIEDGML